MLKQPTFADGDSESVRNLHSQCHPGDCPKGTVNLATAVGTKAGPAVIPGARPLVAQRLDAQLVCVAVRVKRCAQLAMGLTISCNAGRPRTNVLCWPRCRLTPAPSGS